MDAVPAVVLLGVLAAWAPLRLMRCEGCALPFSFPQALYRVVAFEGSCRACPEAANAEAVRGAQELRHATPAPSSFVDRHRRVRAGVEDMVRAQLAEARAWHQDRRA